MKESVKNEWVKALRSGKYNQATAVLSDGDSYCCLGVLCEISGVSDFKYESEFDIVTYLGEGETLPKKVMEFAGLRTCDGQTKNTVHPEDGKSTSIYLTELNDNGKTFDEIADIIDQHWKNL